MRVIDLGNKKILLVRISDVSKVKREQKEAEDQAIQLERTNKLMVGRVLKMVELKKEIEELRTKIKA